MISNRDPASTPPDDWADDTAADIIVIAWADPDARRIIAQMLRMVMIRGAMLQKTAQSNQRSNP